MQRHYVRRQRLPCLALGSLLVSSKTCDGFCTSRARKGTAAPRAIANPAPISSTTNRFAEFASFTADLILAGRLCLSVDQDGASGGDSLDNMSSDFLDVDENTFSSTPVPTRRSRPTSASNRLSLIERIQILSYRTALSASSLLIAALAICSGDVLAGTGVDGASTVEWVESVTPLSVGITLLLAPIPNNDFGRVTLTSLGIVSVASVVASTVLEASSAVVDVQRVLVVLSLVSICIREIFYFGLAYKVEAVVALVMLPVTFMMTSDQAIGISLPVCALAMNVLAAGKIFEPCAEDFERSNSEFLAGGK
jgi:hypothetical protein